MQKQFYLNTLAFCFLMLTGMVAYAQSGKGKVSIFVKDELTFFGIEANVVVQNATQTLSFKTNDGGKLEIEPSVGRHDFTITANGHKMLQSYLIIKEGETINFDVILDRENWLKQNKSTTRTASKQSILEGYIADHSTGKPLAGAEVRFAGKNIKTTTNEYGFFSLAVPDYCRLDEASKKAVKGDFIVSKQGYDDYVISDMLLLEDVITTRLAMEKSKGRTKGVTKDEQFHGMLDKTKEDGKDFENHWSDKFKALRVEAVDGAALQVYHAPPTSIRVGTSCACRDCSSVTTMSLESYTQTGLNDEWIPSWHFHSLRSGAIAYRSYGAHHVLNPIASNYDISNTTCRQVWDSDFTTATQEAAIYTAGFMLTFNNAIAASEYSAETNNTGCGNCFSGTGSSWPCISDSPCCGSTSAGHGRGLCQWGSHRWANGQGRTWSWILEHYYNPGNYDVSSPVRATAITPSVTSSAINQSFNLSVAVQNSAASAHNQIIIDAFLRNTSTGTLYANAAADLKITAATGTNNYTQNFTVPSTVPSGSYNPRVTLYFDVDQNGVVGTGDLALFTFTASNTITINSDATAPTTSVSTTATTYADDFTATFNDADNVAVGDRFYQVLEFNGTEWRGNRGNGFFNDNFGAATINPEWTVTTGTWSTAATAGRLRQTDVTPTNTNINTAITQGSGQSYLYHFAAKLNNTTGFRRFGIHIFTDNATLQERNNSYLIWFSADDQTVRIIETVANVLNNRASATFALSAGGWNDYKVTYNSTSGVIKVYINNTLRLSWTDTTPLTAGNAISLRTNQADVEWDDIKVYKSRSTSRLVTVGPESNQDCRRQSPNTTTPACKVNSLITDTSDNWSAVGNRDLIITFPGGRTEGSDAADMSFYPNPVGTSATLQYSLQKAGKVHIAAYDLQGKLMFVIADGYQSAGQQQISSEQFGALRPGMYLIKLQSEGSSSVVKIVKQ